MTVGQFLTGRISMQKGNILHKEEIWYDIEEAMKEYAKEYAKEMIKLDRINVAKHATSKCLNMPESTCSECEYHIIDKSSILNAPQIELL